MYICLRLTVCLYMSTYPIFFSNHVALRRVSAVPFSYSGLSSFLACFRANSAVFFINFLLLRFYPTAACPCLTGSSAVQHVSVLRNDFSHTFPYVVSFRLTPFFITPQSLHYFCYACVFLVFRSSFQFLGRSAVPSPTVTVITSGRVAPISVGDTVLLVEDVKYRVQKLFPSDGAVVLQKINTRDRPFKRFVSQLWVSPPSTHDAVADVDMPLPDCLRPEPEPSRLLPDTCDSTTQVDIHSTTNDLDRWCSLMTDYSSVDRLQQAFDEARVEARTYFDLNSQLLTELAAVRQEAEEAVTALKTQLQTLQQDNKHLRSSLTDLNATHNSLMAHSLSQTEQIGELRSHLPEKQPPLLPFLRTLLLTLPTDFTDDNTPDDSFYHFLCADPAAD